MQNLIKKYVQLPSNVNSKGWYSVKCEVCHDYKVRGGFNIKDEGVVYHCFNCSTKASYFNNGTITDDMKTVLQAFNIPYEEIQRLILNSLGKQKAKRPTITVDTNNPIIEIPLPNHFYKIIMDGSDIESNIALDYLKTRGIENDNNFFLSKSNKTKEEIKWNNRLIIPYYREGKLIFYQGRSFGSSKKDRYINSITSGDSVNLYGYELIREFTDEPLFITEGFFDSYHIKGMSILGNELTKRKIEIINQSRRKKIYIPDRYGNGKQAAFNALDAGWSVSIPDIGNCKDINEAIMRYGYLYVYKSLLENAVSGYNAKIKVNLTCR